MLIGLAAVAQSPSQAANAAPRLMVALDYRVLPGGGAGVAESCPTQGTFEEAVTAQLDYSPFQPDAPRRIVARVQPGDSGLQGQITWFAADASKNDKSEKNEGERHFSSANPDCAAFVRGMTFAIAVQIQFLNSSAQTAPAPVAVPTTPEPVPVEPVPATLDHLSLALALGPTLSIGSGPAASAGARVRTAFRRNDLSLELSGQAHLPVSWRGVGDMGFSSYVVGVDLAPCGHWGRLSLCALGDIQQLRVRGEDLDQDHSTASIMARTGLRVMLHQALAQWAELSFYVQALYVLTPRTVTISNLPVWTTPPLGVSVGIDLATIYRLR